MATIPSELLRLGKLAESVPYFNKYKEEKQMDTQQALEALARAYTTKDKIGALARHLNETFDKKVPKIEKKDGYFEGLEILENTIIYYREYMKCQKFPFKQLRSLGLYNPDLY